jgi:hypothetical protein
MTSVDLHVIKYEHKAYIVLEDKHNKVMYAERAIGVGASIGRTSVSPEEDCSSWHQKQVLRL